MEKLGSIFAWGVAGLTALLIIMDFFAGGIPDGLVWFYCFFSLAALMYGVIKSHALVFVMKRSIHTVISLFVIATASFLLLRTLPGGPFDQEKALPPAIKENIEAKYGLNKPLIEQYSDYMLGLLQGDFGQSYKYLGRTVWDILSDSFPVSLKLGIYACLIALLFGIPLGLIAARFHNKAADTASMTLAVSGVSLPSFLTAVVAIQFLSLGFPLNLFAPELVETLKEYEILLPVGLWETPRHYIMPCLILGIRPAAFIARLTRASALDVTQSDFIRTARAKGLSEQKILFKHVLKNSLIPVLTYLGPLVAGIITGSFVIETIYAVPGMGKHFIQSVFNRDYPLIMGLTVLFSFLLIVANLVVDVLYKVVDPRIEMS